MSTFEYSHSCGELLIDVCLLFFAFCFVDPQDTKLFFANPARMVLCVVLPTTVCGMLILCCTSVPVLCLEETKEHGKKAPPKLCCYSFVFGLEMDHILCTYQ